MGKYLDKEGVKRIWDKSKKTFAELPKSEGDTEELDYGYAVLVNKETGNKIKVKPENLKNYDTDKYTPIGVIVVPTSHDVYGTGECAMVSLNAMRYDTPDTGGDDQGLVCGYNSTLGTAYTQVPILDSYSSDSPVITKTAIRGYMPSDKFSGYISGQDKKASYINSTTADTPIPSPFKGDDRNELYYATTYGPNSTISNPLAQFNGSELTQIMLDKATAQADWKTQGVAILNANSSGYYPSACCCWRYKTEGTNQGDWYLPAAGELGYMIARANTIDNTITTIQSIWDVGFVLVNADYWSSSEYNNGAWILCISNGQVDYDFKYYSYRVRAFCRVSFPKPDYYLTKKEADETYELKKIFVKNLAVELTSSYNSALSGDLSDFTYTDPDEYVWIKLNTKLNKGDKLSISGYFTCSGYIPQIYLTEGKSSGGELIYQLEGNDSNTYHQFIIDILSEYDNPYLYCNNGEFSIRHLVVVKGDKPYTWEELYKEEFTKEEADKLYQPKGNYATKEEVENIDLSSKEDKFTVGKGLEMTEDRVLNCTLDTTVFKVVDALPSTPASGDENKIHLVKDTEGEEGNLFKEYLYVEDEWELVGQQKLEIDTSNFVTFNDTLKYGKNGLVPKECYSTYFLTSSATTHQLLSFKEDRIIFNIGAKYLTDGTFGAGLVADAIYTADSNSIGLMSASDKTKLDSLSNEWCGTQSEYDALGTYDNNTIYYITEE